MYLFDIFRANINQPPHLVTYTLDNFNNVLASNSNYYVTHTLFAIVQEVCDVNLAIILKYKLNLIDYFFRTDNTQSEG